jgi:acetoacetyl-CoA synthetase
MPGARWFPGAQVNYARQVLRHADAAHAAGQPAIVFQNERMAAPVEITWPELRRQVASLAQELRAMGVGRGDRVCAYLPNTPHTIVAFLACASLGAVWSVCSPDMGPVAVLDRFRQIAPKVLIAVDGQHLRRPRARPPAGAARGAGRPAERAAPGAAGRPRPGRRRRRLRRARPPGAPLRRLDAGEATASNPHGCPSTTRCGWSTASGTTGLPKPIVHGHGGVMLEALKMGTLHNDVGASADTGDRFHWYSSTGWIMWNSQVGAAGRHHGLRLRRQPGRQPAAGQPDLGVLWRFAGAAGATFFGAGAAFYANCLKAGVEPMQEADLSRLRAIGSTGSPLSTSATTGSGSTCRRSTASASGSRPSAAAPTSPAPSSAACARCRWCAARCRCAAWAPRSRPSSDPDADGVGRR